MVKRLFLTPPTLPETTIRRCLTIPNSQEWLGVVNAAILLMAQEWQYEQVNNTDITPEEAAARAYDLYLTYLEGDCADAGTCVIPPNIEIGITFTTRVIRRGPGGYTQELSDGEWVEPTGDYEVPPIPVRDEPTPEENRCLAAINAVTVIEQMYEDATDAYAEFGTLQSVVDAILGVVTSAMGLFGQVTAAAYMSLGQNALDTFFEIIGIIAEDYWQTPFTAELACIFYDNSIDTAGVVTFDFEAINTALIELQAENLGDVDKALLISQVGYFLSILAAGGLNIAGSTTSVTEYDCSGCDDDWCYEFDFTVSDGGFSAYASRAAYNAGSGWGRGASSQQFCQILKVFGFTAHVTRIEQTFNMAPGGSNIRQMRANDVGGAVFTGDISNVPSPLTYAWELDHNITGLWMSGNSTNGVSPVLPAGFRITKLKLFGSQAGGNPFGANNC